MLYWYCLHENVLLSSSSLFYLFLEVLLCSYLGAVYVSCVPNYESVNFCHSDYVGSPTVVTVLAFLITLCVHGTPSLCCIVTIDPVGKENESM